MEETMIYKAFMKWKNQMAGAFIKRDVISAKTRKKTGSGMFFVGSDLKRDEEWMDYISLRDNVNHRNHDYREVLSTLDRQRIELRVLDGDFMIKDTELVN